MHPNPDEGKLWKSVSPRLRHKINAIYREPSFSFVCFGIEEMGFSQSVELSARHVDSFLAQRAVCRNATTPSFSNSRNATCRPDPSRRRRSREPPYEVKLQWGEVLVVLRHPPFEHQESVRGSQGTSEILRLTLLIFCRSLQFLLSKGKGR